MRRMDWTITLSLTALFVVLTALCAWRGAQPPNLAKGPRLVPWRMLMLFAAFGVIVLAAHILSLAGIITNANKTPY
jgi:hypothetical protein